MDHQTNKTVVAALYEAKVKDNEIIRLLQKHCEISWDEAVHYLQNEKFILFPCRNLFEYLIIEQGMSIEEADKLIHTKVRALLANDTELSKLPPAKLFEKIKSLIDPEL